MGVRRIDIWRFREKIHWHRDRQKMIFFKVHLYAFNRIVHPALLRNIYIFKSGSEEHFTLSATLVYVYAIGNY
jgi:hypothetical protein